MVIALDIEAHSSKIATVLTWQPVQGVEDDRVRESSRKRGFDDMMILVLSCLVLLKEKRKEIAISKVPSFVSVTNQ